METLRAYLAAKRLAAQADLLNTALELARLNSYGINSIDRWKQINHAQQRAHARYLRREKAKNIAFQAMLKSMAD